MNITELLDTDPNPRSSGLLSDHKDKLKLSDFLVYPTLDDPDPDSSDIELHHLTLQAMQPQAAALVVSLVEATNKLEVLEVFHAAYQMYCDGELIIDFEAGGWPDFWKVIFSEPSLASALMGQVDTNCG